MLIYPAVDLRAGACVRLLHGRFDAVTRYADDPAAQLRTFAEAGAEWAHVVDLDGAEAREPRQHALIGELASATGLKVQAGGGVRTRAHVETLLNAGVSRVVVGSTAVRDPSAVIAWLEAFGPERIVLALDVRLGDGEPETACDGWAAGSGVSLWDALQRLAPGKPRHLLVTDIGRDGAMAGPNLPLMQEIVARAPHLQLQASGGVRDAADLEALRKSGAAGAIVGRAIYEGDVDLREALGAG